MTNSTLERAANDFVSSLNGVISATLDTSAKFEVEVKRDDERARIEASQEYAGYKAFPLIRQGENPDAPSLLLRARYTVAFPPNDGYLHVVTSAIGLWVDVTGGHKSHRPLVRLEYDRHPKNRPAAHVHLHANSPEMAWLYGSSGQPAPHLHALHFPVGGKRFRPTLEEFLLFFYREGLYTNMKSNWKEVVRRSLGQWKERQAAATARRYPSVAADELRRMGYSIAPLSKGEETQLR